MDLSRVALGYHRGSIGMAERFSDEALKRIKEVENEKLEPYFIKILHRIKNLFQTLLSIELMKML